MENIHITLIQADLRWEAVDANLDRFDQKINGITEKTDLIILPEMFTTGFSMNAAGLAEDKRGKTIKWLQEKSKQINAHIAGSMIFKEKDRYLNRLVWAKPEGELRQYDKKHLFSMLGEDKVYASGKRHLTVSLKGWKIRPFICYDLRFPEWTRNKNNRYDLAVFVANWPQQRAAHWKLLLRARAVENQCYVAGVNRVGVDGNRLIYSGDSAVIDPLGNDLFEQGERECVYQACLSCELLQTYRNRFPVWKDAY